MPVDILVGLQWGDEGKGKIVDILSPQYKYIARFQGGPNAGHTLVINDKKFVFHTLPSGVIQPETINVIGSGMVVNPITLKKEIETLYHENIDIDSRIIISQQSHLILPTHIFLDMFYEYLKGEKKVGSTLRGIGPTYQDKIARVGLRFIDVLSKDFERKYELLKERHLNIMQNYDFDNNLLISLEKEWFDAVEFLRKFNISDTEIILNNAISENQCILAEGAQGTLLDINFGTFPYVTSSSTLSSGCCTGLGIAPKNIRKVFGVFKAYTTRVGEGPFVTELKDKTGELLMTKGNEYGSTTGRPRRCGWLDLVGLKYAVMLNGATDLIITKSDVLSGIDELKACISYKNTAGEDLRYSDQYLNTVIPEYRNIKSWSDDISKTTEYDHLPKEFQSFIAFIESEVLSTVKMISVGPERNQTIIK